MHKSNQLITFVDMEGEIEKYNEEQNNSNIIRTILYTDDFNDFYLLQEEKVQKKIKYIITLIESMYLINTDFVKKLEETEYALYEMRISVGNNEYRTILFSIDNENFIQSTKIILLNSFLKKSSKDYKKQIKKAEKILLDLSIEN